MFCIVVRTKEEYRLPAPADMELTDKEKELKQQFKLDNDQIFGIVRSV